MTFSQQLWQDNLALFKHTIQHPFNQGLAHGTLDPKIFQHYIVQDAHYLLAYGRALSIVAAKAFKADDIIQFSEGAKVAIIVERGLHKNFMQQFGMTEETFKTTPLTLACHHYTNFLTSTAWSESYPIVLAALLPCFWVYAEVGKAIVKEVTPNNPYQAWIDTYSGDEFNQAVQHIITTVDEVAAQSDLVTQVKMKAAYRRGAELEWLFWESAYHQQKWSGLDNLSY